MAIIHLLWDAYLLISFILTVALIGYMWIFEPEDPDVKAPTKYKLIVSATLLILFPLVPILFILSAIYGATHSVKRG